MVNKTYKFQVFGTKEEKAISFNRQEYSEKFKEQIYHIEDFRSENKKLYFDAKADDIIEVTTETDLIWKFRVDEYAEIIRKDGYRSNEQTDDIIEIPGSIAIHNDDRSLFSFLRQKVIKLLVGEATEYVASYFAKKIEDKLILGTSSINLKFELVDWEPPTENLPYLLFFHGTASNTKGAFSGLYDSNYSIWESIYKHYNGRVMTFEHKTLTESPLQNAIDFVKRIPEKTSIQLDVVTHSRGGIVAEWIERVSKDWVSELKKVAFDERYNNDIENIIHLKELLEKREIKIRKIIRVAGPLGGTKLMEDKLDSWLNIILNTFKFIPALKVSGLFDLFSDFVSAVVKERQNINTFPGLESMSVLSNTIRLLNYPSNSISSDLFLVTCDARSSNLWKSIAYFIGDVYFGEDNDMVVETSSMRMGASRESDVFEYNSKEKETHHCNYFNNAGCVQSIHQALTNEKGSIINLFSKLSVQSIDQNLDLQVLRSTSENDPTIFVLPGIMGSNLKVGNEREWLNYFRISRGNLKKLNIENNDVLPDGIHAPTYADLCNFLVNKSFNVVTFAFDWRKSITDSAAKLDAFVHENMKNRKNTEIYFIAHSMGGLVLQAALSVANNKINKFDIKRFLLLGVPCKGSYTPLEILLGKEKVTNMLALLDLTRKKNELIQQFKKYPGLIEMLHFGNNAFENVDFWNKIKDSGISQQEIEAFKKFKSSLIYQWPRDKTVYIAGSDRYTPYFYTHNTEKIEYTKEGDGRVLWADIPENLKNDNTYYVPAKHGAIPSYQKGFSHYFQILTEGKSDGLTQFPDFDSYRSNGLVINDIQLSEFVFPTESGLNFAIGGDDAFNKTLIKDQIEITVVNGDLRMSSFPLVVGHFANDAILSAEKAVDEYLDKQLSTYHLLGNYVENNEESIVVFKENSKLLKGAIVVGLGVFGELNGDKLERSFYIGIINYLLKYMENIKSNKSSSVGVSTLLVGTDYGGLNLSEVCTAFLNAVIEVNLCVENANINELPKINKVEFIELYRYKAIQCGRTIQTLLSQNEDYENIFTFSKNVTANLGAQDYIPSELDRNWWWTRIKLEHGPEDIKNQNLRSFIFTLMTNNRARVEQKIEANNIFALDYLVAKSANKSNQNPRLGHALFEMIFPNDFKHIADSNINLILTVDQETARYPYELMSSVSYKKGLPLSVRANMIRQLVTTNFRNTPGMATNKKAFVIGDPDLEGKYKQLPASKREAMFVAGLLKNNQFSVDYEYDMKGEEVLEHILHTSYKILHFAAHGVHRQEGTNLTGIVLGKNLVLTPDLFSKMRYVPELVFVNCCSLGIIDPALEKELMSKYEVAASIGYGLISLGVKAIVLAGWEVNDAAAMSFSKIFYESMFDGHSFANSVRMARKYIYNNYRENNTWGAYQVYGDPNYIISDQEKSWSNGKWTYLDEKEVEVELDNRIAKLEFKPKTKEFFEELKGFYDDLPLKYKKQAPILEKMATIYSKSENNEVAFSYFESLFLCEEANYNVKSVEQYYRLMINYYFQQNDSNEIQTCIDRLSNLGTMTSERASIVAGGYKRIFQLNRSKKSFENMKESYSLASKIYREKNNDINYYPFFNYYLAETLLNNSWTVNKNELDLAIQNAKNEAKIKPSFWNLTFNTSIALNDLIIANKTKEISDKSLYLIEEYKKVVEVLGHKQDQLSFINHLEFVKMALNKIGKKTILDLLSEKITAVDKIIGEIKKY